MVNYINNRKFYAANEEFLSGSDVFTGYVLRNGDEFTDVYGFPLTASSTFSTDLATSDYFRDRLISDTLSLPNTLSSIIVQPNDILTNRLLNEKFSLLNDNNTYLYKSLQTPQNYLPSSGSVRYAAISSIGGVEKFKWFSTTQTTSAWPDTTNYTEFDFITRGIGVSWLTTDDKFTLFCTSSSHFIALTGDDNNLTRVEQSTYVSQSGYDLQFEHITSIDFNNNYLYVCDKGASAVHKYDVTSYLTGDTGFKNRRIRIESLGSVGSVEDKSKFKEPTIVTVKSDRIAVYDSGNYIIKIYDQNFNFLQKVAVGNMKNEPAVAMRYNTFTNELYVITQTSSDTLKLYKIDSDYTTSDAITLAETLTTGEDVKEISFSSNDSNFWYLTTTKYIYKKLINNPQNNIGAYNGDKIYLFYTYKWNYATFVYSGTGLVWNSDSNRTSSYDKFIGITPYPSKSNHDKMYMFKYGRFYRYDEPNSYLRIVNFFNKSNYSIESISLSNKEFVQPPVYNKELYKILSNLLALKNNIVGKYYGSYDLNGAYRLEGFNYLVNLNNFVIKTVKNFIVHQNEGVNYYTVNRTLRKIYDLQQTLLNAIVIDIDGLVPYPLTSDTLIVD
jgi:hypothetical protein